MDTLVHIELTLTPTQAIALEALLSTVRMMGLAVTTSGNDALDIAITALDVATTI